MEPIARDVATVTVAREPKTEASNGKPTAAEFGKPRVSSIETPLLAIFSYPSAPFPSQTSDPAKLAASRATEKSREEAQLAIFREQPHAKVIVIPNATHYIFLSREEEVISQITDFVNSLPAKR
jgi:non-heme chloroperoxidase